MKTSRRSTLLALGLSAWTLNVGSVNAADLEEVYNLYLQGNYKQAQLELDTILSDNPSGDVLDDMKKKLGTRALLEMSQNEFLRNPMRIFNAAAWQSERTQFKSPRRIQFFIEQFMADDGTRHKSMPNILAAGSYAVPFLVDYLKVDNSDVITRGLAYQLLLNMGQEVVPSLLACTFSEDPMLLTNIIRLLGKTRDERALPYLLRLQANNEVGIVKDELAVVLPQYGALAKVSLARTIVEEANRYLRESERVHFETIEADGVLWMWNKDKQSLEAYNPLGLEFEYQPQYPASLWPLLRAEQIHQSFSGLKGLAPAEEQGVYASTLCAWVLQEHRVQQLLKADGAIQQDGLEDALVEFLKTRSQKMDLAHWLGSDILLQALDMSQKVMPAFVSARLLRMVAGYQPSEAVTGTVTSYINNRSVQPLINGLSHPEEIVRYWSAIAVARCDASLSLKQAGRVVHLMEQAIAEVGVPSVLLLAKPTEDAKALQAKLEGMGQLVIRHDDAELGLAALNTYPSKDVVILDPSFSKHMEGLDVVNRLRKTQKGSDVPLVILTNEEMRGTHIITYQEQAQEMILGTDSVTTLKQKLEALSSDTAQVSGHDLASEVSYESLSAMVLLEDQAVARYPSLVQHLSDLLGSPIQPEASQVLAIRTLRKMGKIAAPSVHVLLDLLDGEASVEYKLVVLHALLSVSDANAEVKAKLYEIMVDASSPQSFRQMAATYLSAHQADLTPEERHVFQQSFFTSAFGAELSR